MSVNGQSRRREGRSGSRNKSTWRRGRQVHAASWQSQVHVVVVSSPRSVVAELSPRGIVAVKSPPSLVAEESPAGRGRVADPRLRPDASPFKPRDGVAATEGVPYPPTMDAEATRRESPAGLTVDGQGPGFQAPGATVSEVPDPPIVAGAKERPRSIYMRGRLEGKALRFLVDTGAEVTSISLSILDQLPRQLREQFKEGGYFVTTVSGAKVMARGPVTCNLTIGGRTIVEPVIAMDIACDAILGLPAMESLGTSMTVAGESVLPRRTSTPTTRNDHRVLRVLVEEDFVIPAGHEACVPCRIEGQTEEDLVIEECWRQ
jgi:hypothetical protein